MPVFNSRLAELAFKEMSERLLPEEETELRQIIHSSDAKWQLYQRLTNQDAIIQDLRTMTQVAVAAQYEKIRQEAGLKKTVSLAWIAKAAALLLIAAGALYFFTRTEQKKQVELIARPGIKDFIQFFDKARLTLSNGQVISLDSAANGLLAREGNVHIVRKDSFLVYEAPATHKVTTGFNTLATYPGGQSAVMLPDGSKVWLNSATGIRYPLQFSGPHRNLTLSGEGWFEIRPDPDTPFIIKVVRNVQDAASAEICTIEVLGTQFNIKAYSKEETVLTTLMTGRLKVHAGKTTLELQPGQQALIDKQGQLKLIQATHTESDIAWKQHLFLYKNANLRTIMNDIERNYNVTVQYEGDIPPTGFDLAISRSKTLNAVLDALKSENVQFIVDHKTITVRLSK